MNECFKAIGDHTKPNADGTCPTGYRQKIDGGYVRAAARSGNYGYFGTLANVICPGISTFTTEAPAPHLVDDANVCEYAKSSGTATFGPKPGDARTPQVLRVNADTQKVEDISPKDDPLFQLRTDLDTGRGVVEGPDGNLYLAARRAGGTGSDVSGLGGVTLKWTGTEDDPPGSGGRPSGPSRTRSRPPSSCCPSAPRPAGPRGGLRAAAAARPAAGPRCARRHGTPRWLPPRAR
ncbi:hypothetical protein ACFWVU_27260 [Streptomyces sp. NPDC058686]|uniref:hypothetical protein n=1 Tax=Streptomyces sp. NPDC058686 TaxID=3346599 RepID=UPI00364B40A8